MKTKLKFVLIMAAVVLVLDQLTKLWVVQHVPIGSEFPVLSGFFDIVHGRNTGAAFGMLSQWNSVYRDWFFYGIAVIAIIFLYFYIQSVSSSDHLSLLALSFILGGALGNISDRIFRGSVVDFLSVHYHEKIVSLMLFGYNLTVPLSWPAFNVADMAISCAVVFLVVRGFKKKSS